MTISKPFFNPTMGQSIGMTFALAEPGSLDLVVLDRDGFPVRTLARSQAVEAGTQTYAWDGKDDSGVVVPDEAYSLKIEMTGKSGVHRYVPAAIPAHEIKATPGYYDRSTATFSYQLEAPARVHLQAGIAQVDPKTGASNGPVLKTLINREPRPAGAVIQTWNGLDETHSYSVAELPGFVMGIAATSLPENALITIGKPNEPFLARAAVRSGLSVVPVAEGGDHHHHRGLSTLDDVSPALSVSLSNAKQSTQDRIWHFSERSLKGTLRLAGPGAANFARQPGKLLIFIDSEKVETRESPTSGMEFEVPLRALPSGTHIVAFDWASDYGPVAVTSLRIERARPPAPTSQRGGGR